MDGATCGGSVSQMLQTFEMFGALIRAAERWRSVKVTEFERRQMTAVRKELDQEYEAMVGLNAKPSKDAAQVRISSSSWT
jgi:putative transposase